MNSSKSAHDQEWQMDDGKLLETVEVTTADKPEYAVIWMHGLGADGHDFEPIIPFLGLPPDAAIRFVFPHALMRPITINGGAVMRAWYDIIEISTSSSQDEAGISHSAAKIRDPTDHEIERGIPAEKIIVAGFSQGGAMALHVGLRYPAKLAGIMALSAYLLFPERLATERAQENSATPVFIGHGTQDPVLPMMLGKEAREGLEKGEWPVEWHSYSIQHSVSQPEMVDIGHWLETRFN